MMDLQYTNDGFFDVLPQLALDGNNKVLKTIDNFVTIFQNDIRLKNCLAYNELFGTAENLITGRRWEEADDSIVMSYIEKNTKSGIPKVITTLLILFVIKMPITRLRTLSNQRFGTESRESLHCFKHILNAKTAIIFEKLRASHF